MIATNLIVSKMLSWLLLVVCVTASVGAFIDYTEPTAVIQQRAGYDIPMQCGLGEAHLHDAPPPEIQFNWFFKQCGESVGIPCNELQDHDWTQLPCEQNFCQSTLLLRNVTEKYSGLYKCERLPHRAEIIDIDRTVRIYQVVVRPDREQLASPPEFTESLPTNKTVFIGSQVVFQCRVRSAVHPSIKWFRRIPEFPPTPEHVQGIEAFNGPIVKHMGQTYELLQSSPEKLIDDDVYLSKLLLSEAHFKHTGFYACVAINYRGHVMREAYLSVVMDDDSVLAGDKDYWSDYDEELGPTRTDPRQFVLLFLMPLGLAMLPALVWLCYVTLKRCRRDDSDHNGDEDYFREDTMTTDKSMLRHA